MFISVNTYAEGEMYEEIHGNGTYTVSERWKAKTKVRMIKDELESGGLLEFADHSERALDAMIYIAKKNLRYYGFEFHANKIEREWESHKGSIMMLALNLGKENRPIGDYQPLSEWLAGVVDTLIEKLSWDVVHALRLTDISSLNYGLRYIFVQPCSNGLSEFNYHFADDPKYRAVFPVVARWSASITCNLATFGAGIWWLCGPVSMLVEFGASKIAPGLGERIYGWACE